MSTTAHFVKRSAPGTLPLSSSRAMALVLVLLAVTVSGIVAAMVVAATNHGTIVHLATLAVSAVSSALLAALVVSSYRSYRREIAEHSRSGEIEAGLFDPETGTFGPRYVEFSFRHEMLIAHQSQEPLALMSASFDYDRTLSNHGPEAADHLVHVTAQILKRALRGADVICHYTNGEFVVLLPETDLGQSDIPRRRIMRAAEKWNSTTRTRYRLALKVGAADAWEGLAEALRDARLAASGVTPPPYTTVGYVPRSSAIN